MKSRQQSGFTLIEIMVTMVILAMLSGLVVISIGDSFYRKMHGEAERFSLMTRALSDEAIFGAMDLGILMRKDGYEVKVLDRLENTWQDYPGDLQSRQLDELMRLRWTIEGYARYGSDQLEMVELELTDENGEESLVARDIEGLTPQILILSSGEMTAFSAEFYAVEEAARDEYFEVRSDGFSMPVMREQNQSRPRQLELEDQYEYDYDDSNY